MTRSPGIDRRTALASIGVAAAAAAPAFAGVPGVNSRLPLSADDLGFDRATGEYVLPPLPYATEALEPHLDAATMAVHHGKHHAAYVAGLNKAVKELARIRDGQGDPAYVKHWSRELAFHGAGHVNHALLWLTLAPAGSGGGGVPGGALGSAIDRDFGSFERFVAHFKAAAGAVEGSGWAWLVHEPVSSRLLVLQVEKQQDMMLPGVAPLLGVDVWEHAYYLKYQNRRAEYVNAFMNVIHWAKVAEFYDRAIK